MRKKLILFDKIGEKAKFLAKETGADIAIFSDLIFYVTGKEIKVWLKDSDIRKYDVVYIRRADHSLFSLAGSLAQCLDHLKVNYYDRSFGEIGAAGDKFTSLIKLAKKGLPVIPTFFCMRSKIPEISDKIEGRLGFPMVAKELTAQHSTGIFVIRERKDFDKLPRKIYGREPKFLFQKKINIEKEYRLVVMGNKITSVQRMYRDLSGFAAKVDMTKDYDYQTLDAVGPIAKKVAIGGAKALNIQIAGADIAFEGGTNKVFLIEVNRGPGFTYDTKISPEIPELAKFLR